MLKFEATDPDSGADLTWSLTGNDADDFDITKNMDGDGVLTFDSSPDFESPAGSPAMMADPEDNTYEVTINVSDGKADDGTAETPPVSDDDLDVIVTVTNVNDPPTFDTTPANFDIDENTETTTVIATYMASDEDGDTLTWDLDGDDDGDFTITRNSDGDGELKLTSKPNFESAADNDTNNDYEVTIKVTDDGTGNLSVSQAITITVNDVNDAPVITSTGTAFTALSADENTLTTTVLQTYARTDEDMPSQILTWSLEGTDDGEFAINSSTGALTFNNVPNYEMPADNGANNVYNVTVKVTDSGSPMESDTLAVTITVNNVNEAPAITSTGTGFTAPSFMEIEYDATGTPDLSVADYDGSDPDTQTGNTLTWSVEGTDAGDFDINSNTGELTFKNAPNFEEPEDGNTNNDYNITVKVRDNGIPGDRGTGSQLEDTITVTVTVTDVNERPDIMEDTVSSYSEIEYDSTDTRPNIHTFSAQDYDAGDTFTWSLGGEDSADLDIGSNSGVLTFDQAACANDGPLPDY